MVRVGQVSGKDQQKQKRQMYGQCRTSYGKDQQKQKTNVW